MAIAKKKSTAQAGAKGAPGVTKKAAGKAAPAAKNGSAGKPAAKAKAAALPTAKQLAEVAGVTFKPLLKPAQIQRLRRALPGYANLLDDVAELLERDGQELNLRDVTPDDLLRVQAQQKELAAKEAVLETVYLSAYHQRLVLDDEGIGMLQKIARRVQSRAEESPELPLRFKSLLDFLATFRPGRPAKAKPEAGGEPVEG